MRYSLVFLTALVMLSGCGTFENMHMTLFEAPDREISPMGEKYRPCANPIDVQDKDAFDYTRCPDLSGLSFQGRMPGS